MSEPRPSRREEPPTLPPPPLWRLMVAGLVIIGFLYGIYAYEKGREEAAPPPPSSGLIQHMA
jgi:hypothetical protein